jgi:hypothetical protein
MSRDVEILMSRTKIRYYDNNSIRKLKYCVESAEKVQRRDMIIARCLNTIYFAFFITFL